jgi:hypothetical protein
MNVQALERRVRQAIENNDRAVERAIMVLYARQTEDERKERTTKHSNGRGFSGAHASIGTYWANWIRQGRQLSGLHLVRARAMAFHYVGQLLEEAQLKAASEAAERAAIQAESGDPDSEDPPSTLRSPHW